MPTTDAWDGDQWREECGVFGIFGSSDAAAHTALGLHALQHRGQEAAGLVTFDGEQFHTHRALGLVGDNFGSEDVIGGLPGTIALGHVRYSTTGCTVLRNVQPLFAEFEFGGLAIAHNGNLTNAYVTRRSLVRRGREKLPLVSMVGYTNAGKSSLFNGLSGAHVLVADQLFATLDPTIRKTELAGIGTVLLSDTVGFIQGLPTTLVEAFRGTLEEVRLSNLLLHVVDMSDPQHLEHSHQVEETLEEIGAGAIPRIVVLNKIDQVDMAASVRRFGTGEVRSVAVSAATGEGMTGLQGVIVEHLRGVRVLKRLRLPPTSYRLRAQVYSLARVESERIDEEGHCVLDIEIGAASEGRLAAQKEFNVAYWAD